VATIAVVHASVERGRAASAQRRVVGPFGVLGRQFVVESPEPGVADAIGVGCVDLESACDAGDTTVYRVERVGPPWHPYGWCVRRDDELLGADVLGTYVPTMIPSDFARRVIHGRGDALAISGVALARDGRAVVLAADAILGWVNPADGPLDLFAVAAHCMRRGWGLVALDVVPIDGSGAFASVDPFHRPFAAEAGTPLAAMLSSTDFPALLPASRLGPLVGRTNIGAFVIVAPSDVAKSRLESGPPSAVLRALASRLSGSAEVRRTAFIRLAELAEQIPGHVLRVTDDLGAASMHLELVA